MFNEKELARKNLNFFTKDKKQIYVSYLDLNFSDQGLEFKI